VGVWHILDSGVYWESTTRCSTPGFGCILSVQEEGSFIGVFYQKINLIFVVIISVLFSVISMISVIMLQTINHLKYHLQSAERRNKILCDNINYVVLYFVVVMVY